MPHRRLAFGCILASLVLRLVCGRLLRFGEVDRGNVAFPAVHWKQEKYIPSNGVLIYNYCSGCRGLF